MLPHGLQGAQWAAVIVLGVFGVLGTCSDATHSEPNIGSISLVSQNAFLTGAFDGMCVAEGGSKELVSVYLVDTTTQSSSLDPFEPGLKTGAVSVYQDLSHIDISQFYVFLPVTLWGSRSYFGNRAVINLDMQGELWLCFILTLIYENWRKHNLGGLITKSSNWVAMGKVERSRRQSGFGGHSLLFWLVFLGLCTHVHGVTCNSCFDGIEGCAGGDACLFATRTAANLVALTAVGGAAINVASLLPAAYVRHLPAQILRTLAAIARVPAGDAPPDLGAMTLNELTEALTGGRIDMTMYKGELSARLADPVTAAAQVTRISAMLLACQSQTVGTTTRSIDGISSYGALGYLVAVASMIVNSGKRTYSAGTSTGGSTSSGTTASLSIRVPTSGSQFSELLMVWQTLAHAVGAANILATVPFVQQVVWDGISTLGLMWEEAYCLFIIYIEAIEDSQGTLNLANVFAAGAQDTRIKAAKQRHTDVFGPCKTCDDEDKDKDKDKGAKKWNHKCSPNANSICKTFNFRDAEHPKQHLYKDGTCKFRHVCNQWVTGKGAGGMCEQDHPKWQCNNPDKTNTKPTQ